MYNFKRYTKTRSKLSNNTISITGSYSFGFNSGFYHKENIKDFKKVVFFFDSDKNAIGFYFTNDESSEGAFTIIHGKSGTTGSVTARSFFLNNNIDRKEYRNKIEPDKIKHEGLDLYVINLSKNDELKNEQEGIQENVI
ncbi:MAG: hypothetical protein HQ539_00310 [Parcubacteria group bacterium]|nr:hypothetical protein [Parcubacteria group bacterium]